MRALRLHAAKHLRPESVADPQKPSGTEVLIDIREA